MRARQPIAVLAALAVAGALLLTVGPARAKENVTARLLTPLPLDAAPGERLTVAWALRVPTSGAGARRSAPSECSSGC